MLSGKQIILLCSLNQPTLSRSLEFNLKSRVFNELFPELRKEAEEEVIKSSEDEDGDHDVFHHHKG